MPRQIYRHATGHAAHFLRGVQHAYHNRKIIKAAGRHLGKYVKARSHGHNKSKTHQETMKGDDIHSGVTDYSTVVLFRKSHHKTVDYKAAKVSFTENVQGVVGGEAGIDRVQTIAFIGTTSQWAVSSGAGAFNYFTNPEKSPQNYFSFNPSRYVTGGAFTSFDETYATDKFYLSTVNLKMSLSNFENASSSCWIYVLEAACSHNYSPEAAWQMSLNMAKCDAVGAVQVPAGGAIATATVGGGQPDDPNTTPGQTANFKRWWRIKKVHRVNLAPAAQEDVDIHIKFNQMGSLAKLIALNTDYTQVSTTWTNTNISVSYPSGCAAIMLVNRGALVMDTTTNTTTCTYSQTKLGVAIQKFNHFYPVKANTNRINVEETYIQIPYATTAAKQALINVIDGQDIVKAAA